MEEHLSEVLLVLADEMVKARRKTRPRWGYWQERGALKKILHT